MELNSLDTKLSNRTINVLSKNNINTLEQLLTFANSKKFLSKSIRGLGRQSNYEIINFVEELEGKESDKQLKLKLKIRDMDLAELEHSIKKNIEKYGVETVSNLCITLISENTKEE
jgi:DNA-directed RNA polymerase alpha subunit